MANSSLDLIQRVQKVERSNRRLKWWGLMAPVATVLFLLLIWQIVPSTLVTVMAAGKSVEWGFWEVLVGLASLSLGGLAILIGLGSIAIVIWGKPWIEGLVRDEAAKCVATTEKELRGLLHGYIGYVFGRLRDVNKSFINSAIEYSKSAYDLLSETSSWKRSARNNLAFYLACREYETDAPEVVRLADVLLTDYAQRKEVDYLTTYAAIIAQYYAHFDRPRQRLMDAERMMEELQQRDDVTIGDKQNAARHLNKIRAALAKMGGA